MLIQPCRYRQADKKQGWSKSGQPLLIFWDGRWYYTVIPGTVLCHSERPLTVILSDSEESGGDEPLLNSGTVLQILHSACGFVQDDKGTNDNGLRTRHFRIILNANVL